MGIYQHWDPLKKIMLGSGYPPEFYSWIKDPKARTAMERIAQETEEDFLNLKKLLEDKFNVDVVRPKVGSNYEEYYIPERDKFVRPPMTPRDYSGKFGETFYIDGEYNIFFRDYPVIKDPSWPNINNINEMNKLEDWQIDECKNIHHMWPENHPENQKELQPYYDCLNNNNIDYTKYSGMCSITTADVCRIGKDLIYPVYRNTPIEEIKKVFGDEYRINYYKGDSHGDSCFCPVVPGLIVSLKGYVNYSDTLPGWEVVELPNQSWDKIDSFLQLKRKNKGKWWVKGEENNNALTMCVEDWLDNWVGYVEETVFDVNMLVIDEKNVICNNYNKKVFDALERHGVTPHIFNFRHRYFWDGGLHCITADIEREGEMKDYFPERNEY